MALTTPRPVFQLSDSFQTVFSLPRTLRFVTKSIHLVNTSGSDAEVSVCLVPYGGAAAQANALLWDFTITAGDFVEFLEGDTWPAGSSLQAKANVTGVVNCKVTGQVL